MEEDKFLTFVMSEAEKLDKVFILDCGEGNSSIDETNGYEIEDLSGWLVDKSNIEKIVSSIRNNTAYTEFSNEYVLAKWNKSNEGQLNISFERY